MHSKASSMKYGGSILLLLLCVHGFLISESFAFNNAGRSLSVPSRIQSRSIASSVSSFRSAPLVLRTHRNAVQFDDKDPQNKRRDNGWTKRRVESCKRFAGRTRSWMSKVLFWKTKKGKSLLAAAAFSLAVLFSSGQQISSYTPVGATPQTEINVLNSRGGGNGGAATGRQQPSRSATKLAQQNLDTKVGTGKGAVTAVATAADKTSRTLKDAIDDLGKFMKGPRSDTLLLLLATAVITPLCKMMGTSPILGFLASGMLMGPNGFGLINDLHTTEVLAELGIVFFLFEMGIELSVERLLSMKRDVFGLGLSQFLCSAVAIAGVGKVVGLPANALVVLGGGLALSSSAFVLQLLKDKSQLASRFGKASFGVLLFQDLAVVPLLVVTPILAGGGSGLAAALGSAVLKAGIALGSITIAGRYLLNPLFKKVAGAQSQEAFLGVILLTVLSMSFMTEGLGLSNTLGAFLAGVLLSETKYRYQVEADIAPFRGILLGLFFVTVGFEIDLALIFSRLPAVSAIVFGIMFIKTAVLTMLSLAFGLSLSVSQQTGLILSQGGEFAFVAFGLARSLGILDQPTTKLLLTSVSLTMALTPAMAAAGDKLSKKLEEKSDFTHYLGQDRDATEIKESDDFAVVIGYGAVGKVVCDLLDRKLVKYVGIDNDPKKAIQARNAGLPVFYGDIGRQEVADAFNVGKAKAVVVCISDRDQANRAVIALRRFYPDVKIFSRARDKDHAERLQSTLNVAAMVPILPEDNLLLTLPFGGAVLKALGGSPEEVNAILESKRKEVMSGISLVESEEDMALVQLGIEPEVRPEKNKKENKINTEEGGGGDVICEKSAAASRIEQIKEKSPFVAEVIGDAFPQAEKK
uniref:RCK N-terminal domain-containing protein n=1 Tax=Pseudo-nitzschia australis TaxID=44445 RepID=A0A7S4A8U6_9STRA